MDVYVTNNNHVKVLDFNPITSTTSPLLFSWDDLPYQHMKQQQQQEQTEEEDEQQQQQPEQLEQQQQPQQQQQQEEQRQPGSLEGQPRQQDTDSDEATDSDEESSIEDVPFLLVDDSGMIQPGQRQACGMPFDMLQLQDSMDDIIELMRRQQRQQQQAEH